MVSLIIENAGNLRFTANVIGPLLSPNKQCILFEKVNKIPYTIQNLLQAPKTFPN